MHAHNILVIAVFLVIASLRSNLSFLFWPALENRDRFVPRDDMLRRAQRVLSLRAQRGNLSFACPGYFFVIASLRSNLSFLFWPALEKRDRFVPRDDRVRLRAKRGNLSFLFWPALERRDRFVPRDDMLRRAQRGNLSFACPGYFFVIAPFLVIAIFLVIASPSCFVIAPFLVIASLRSNLSFLFWPALEKRDRFVPRDDRVRLRA